VWWSVTPGLRRLKQENYEFKTSLGYIARSCSKQRKVSPESKFQIQLASLVNSKC
jgi:hypothetical protein